MKNLITICTMLLTSLTLCQTTIAQVTYWDHTFTDDFNVGDGNFAFSDLDNLEPHPVVITDRFGNVFSAFYQAPTEFKTDAYIQIEKFSSSGTFLAIATIEGISGTKPIKLAADNSGNIYILATVEIPGYDGSDIYFAKFRPNLILAWEHLIFSEPYDVYGIWTPDYAGDLLINTKAGTEIYISGYLDNVDGLPSNFVARYNTSGVLLNISFPNETAFYNGLELKQANDGRIYTFINSYDEVGSYAPTIVRFPDGSPAYTNNLDAKEEFTFDLGDEELRLKDQFEVDDNGVLYFIISDPDSEYEEGNGVCAISPEDGILWNTLDLPESDGLPEKMSLIRVDRSHRNALYVAGISGEYPEYDLILSAIDRANGEVYSYNVVDTTTIDILFGIRKWDHSSEFYFDGVELNVELQGLPLELIVTADKVYLESFGWYKYIGDPNPVYFINALTKDLAECTLIDQVPVQPNPYAIEGGACDDEYANHYNNYHPYQDNSNMQYSRSTDQLNLIYTNRYSVVTPSPGLYCEYNYDFFAEVILRSYTDGFKLSEEYNQNLPEVSVYPNPASQYFTITVDDDKEYQLEIIDLAGRILKTEFFTENYLADISQLAKGMYMIQIKNNDALFYSELLTIQ